MAHRLDGAKWQQYPVPCNMVNQVLSPWLAQRHGLQLNCISPRAADTYFSEIRMDAARALGHFNWQQLKLALLVFLLKMIIICLTSFGFWSDIVLCVVRLSMACLPDQQHNTTNESISQTSPINPIYQTKSDVLPMKQTNQIIPINPTNQVNQFTDAILKWNQWIQSTNHLNPINHINQVSAALTLLNTCLSMCVHTRIYTYMHHHLFVHQLTT